MTTSEEFLRGPTKQGVPAEWHALALKYHGFVAGGAPRDWWTGKDITDIDIYTWVEPTNLPAHTLDIRPKSKKYSMPYLKAVYQFEDEGFDVEVMVLDSKHVANELDVVETFAESISQFWMDPVSGVICYTEAAARTMKTNICVHYRNKWVRDLAKNHRPRQKIIRKFPEYQHLQEIL